MEPNVLSVDYGVLRDNFSAFRLRFPKTSLAPVVKADAYGHDLVKTSRAFLAGGAERLTVFRVSEAARLRGAGIQAPIWCLLGPLPDEVHQALTLTDVTFGIFCRDQATALSRGCLDCGRRMAVHMAVDTGMGRLGVLPNEAPEAARWIETLPGLELRGCYSHVANGTEPDNPVTQGQVAAFRAVLMALPKCCRENHLCASNALLCNLAPELPFARPGICLYMQTTIRGDNAPITEDAMSLRSQLVSVKRLPAGYPVSYGSIHVLARDSVVGVVPVGYDDGYQRSMSDKGCVLVCGTRVPQLGRICMSMTMVDLTDVPAAAVGDEVVLLGRQGNEVIHLRDLARWADTTEHELTCMMGTRR